MLRIISLAAVATALAGCAAGTVVMPPDYEFPPGVLHHQINHLEFCQRMPAECEPTNVSPDPIPATAANMAAITAVQDRVQGELRRVAEAEDFWSLGIDGAGDCEDFANLKRHYLIAEGFPSNQLLLAWAWINAEIGWHVILLANTTAGVYVLDMNYSNVILVEDYPFHIHRVQRMDDPTLWVNID